MIGALARAMLPPVLDEAGAPNDLLIARVGVDDTELDRLLGPDSRRRGTAPGRTDDTGPAVVDLDEIGVDRPLAQNPVGHLLLLAGTMTDLRRAVTVRGLLPAAANVTIAVGVLPYLRPAPLPVASAHSGWRHLRDLRVRLIEKKSWVMETEFSEPIPAGEVLAAAARAFGGDHVDAMPQPRAGLAGFGVTHWRPGDPNVALRPSTDATDCDVVLVAGTPADALPGAGPASGHGTVPRTSLGTGPGTGTGAGPGTSLGTGPGTSAGSVQEISTGSRAGTTRGTGPRTTETGPWTYSGTNSGPGHETGPGADLGTGPKADGATGPGADAEARPGTHPEAGPRSGTGSGLRPDSGTGPRINSGSGHGAGPGTPEVAGAAVPRVVSRPEPVEWSRFAEPHGYEHLTELTDPSMVPPVDERSVNPGGFLQAPPRGYGRLEQHGGRWAAVWDGRVLVRFAASGGVTDADVARLRKLRGLHIEWRLSHTGPVAAARVIAGLAAAGVPLIAPDPPGWARTLLGEELATLLTGTVEADLADDLAREVHSVRLRRRALRSHGTRARWRQLAAGGVPGTGVPGGDGPAPKVSVVLCTRRADMLRFAVSQVARQRGVDLELVLGLHGVPLAKVEEAVRSVPFPVTICEADPALPLGAVLNQAFAQASGTFVTKMDDDDWYGPDHLADLALAHMYSGADLLGAPAEFVHLEQIGVTVQRSRNSERFRDSVAGGTLFMTRGLFEAVGGFRPVPRHVDGEFCRAVRAAGGRVYQIHGLGYILRRRAAQGHTWREPIGYFLAQRNRRQWRGWYANPLMELT